ncbi:MAG TPA: hypothetical protein VIW29_10565 [Polyangiaceae bacterium]
MTIVLVVQYLPTHCRGCGSVALISGAAKGSTVCTCPRCGGEAHAVPGPTFAVHEQELFAQLVLIASRAQLRPAEAQRLCIDIEMGLARGDQPGMLERLSDRFPELAVMAPLLASSPARQARTLRMLETILNALSSPRKSLSMPVMPVVTSAHKRNG